MKYPPVKADFHGPGTPVFRDMLTAIANLFGFYADALAPRVFKSLTQNKKSICGMLLTSQLVSRTEAFTDC